MKRVGLGLHKQFLVSLTIAVVSIAGSPVWAANVPKQSLLKYFSPDTNMYVEVEPPQGYENALVKQFLEFLNRKAANSEVATRNFAYLQAELQPHFAIGVKFDFTGASIEDTVKRISALKQAHAATPSAEPSAVVPPKPLQKPSMLFIIPLKDKQLTIPAFIKAIEKDSKALAWEPHTEQGITYYYTQEVGALAVVDEQLIYSPSEIYLKSMLAQWSQANAPTLAQASFTQSLLQHPFAPSANQPLGFMLFHVAKEEMQPLVKGTPLLAPQQDSTMVGNIGVSYVNEDHPLLALDFYSPFSLSAYSDPKLKDKMWNLLKASGRFNEPNVLPADTDMLMSYYGLGSSLEYLFASAVPEKNESTVREQLVGLLAAMGFDLDKDILLPLSKDVSLALITTKQNKTPEATGFNAWAKAFVLSMSDTPEASGLVKKLTGLMANPNQTVTSQETAVSQVPMTVYTLASVASPAVKPATLQHKATVHKKSVRRTAYHSSTHAKKAVASHAVHKPVVAKAPVLAPRQIATVDLTTNQVLAISHPDTLKKMILISQGQESSLAHDPTFQQITQNFGNDGLMLMYCNLSRLFSKFSGTTLTISSPIQGMGAIVYPEGVGATPEESTNAGYAGHINILF